MFQLAAYVGANSGGVVLSAGLVASGGCRKLGG